MTNKEVIKKYGDVELSFYSYWKYGFSFVAEIDDVIFDGYFGGGSDDIYRYAVDLNTKIKVSDFEDKLMSMTIRKGDEVIFNYVDFN